MIKYLHTPTVKRQGAPALVDELDGLVGFRSVYGFPPDTVGVIRQRRSMAKLAGHAVYTDDLLVDFDDQPAAAQEFEELLMENGVAFMEYESGNRSVHFHVPCQPMTGDLVPQSQLTWIREQAPLADTTVYRPASLFRLPNTWHEKNPGHSKALIKTNAGRRLNIPLIEVQSSTTTYPLETPSSLKLERAMNSRRHQGSRRVHAWYIANEANKLHFSEPEALDLVARWNSRYAEPKLTQDVICLKVSEAYRQSRR